MSKVKAFEEELDDITMSYFEGMSLVDNCYQLRTEVLDKFIVEVKAVHQAEMDRVVDKSIGKQQCTNDCTAPYGRESRPTYMAHSYACRTVRMRIKQQRARYKAIKESNSVQTK